eukprot:scaffold3823_cov109-Skeletonema_menzelii.AAC.2
MQLHSIPTPRALPNSCRSSLFSATMTSSGSSSSSAMSSTSDSSDGSNEMMKASSNPPQKILLDDGDSDDDDDGNDLALKSNDTSSGFNINTQFAREYEQRKRREELTKHRKVNFDLDGNEIDDDSSSSESEDEEGELLTPHLDAQIAKTLKALRRKDESVYDKNATFYTKGDDSDDESSGDKKMKRKTYKDVVREQILEQMDEEDGNANGKEKTADGAAGDLAYDEEQRDIRRAFLESTRDNIDDENNNGSDDDEDNWLKPKAKSKTSPDDDDDDEARKLWEQELQDTAAAAASEAPNKSKMVDPHGEVQDGDKFLMEFMTHKKWLENGANKFNPEKDDDESLEDLERMDEFESKYNFRFEEAAAAADSTHNADSLTSGASHSIVHYARGSNAENVLRRKDESRRQKRLARKERKAEERKAKEEQLRRLKNARREELDERMKQVKNVLGSEEGKPDAALGSAEEEMILKLMEGDYNPEKFEQVMNSVYGDEYYEKEDEAWKNDQDVKRDLASATEESDVLGDGEMYDEENADDNDDEEVGDEYYDEEAYDEEETPFETAEENTEMNEKLKSKMMDELYKLDYEDIIGDMPTRFKYRTVEKNSFGLSTEEILFAKDSTLKQFVSLKKMATYNEEEYQPGTKKRKRFRQLLKSDREDMKEELGAVDEKQPTESSEADGEKKKKRRRQKKNNKKSTASTSDVATETNDAANEEKQEQSEKKQKRRDKKKQTKDHQAGDELMKNINVVETKEEFSYDRAERKKAKKSKSKAKDGSKKYSDGGKKKKKHSSKVDGVSGARLAAYGF